MKHILSIVVVVFALLLLYGALAYWILPKAWRHEEHRPSLQKIPKITRTAADIPGDPLNVALMGTRAELFKAMKDAGWSPADPVTFDSSAKIVESVLLHRPDPKAPVSPLYLFGRKQDLAFEKTVGGSAKERHHVRFWELPVGRTGPKILWMGAATFDRGYGFGHRTGEITHHIAPDIDAEREQLIQDLENTGRLFETYLEVGIGPTPNGRNGEGDPYFTDGMIRFGILKK